MNKKIFKEKKYTDRPVFLYRFVFNSRIPTIAVFLLLISFFLQPIERTYAAESGGASPALNEPATSMISEQDFSKAVATAENLNDIPPTSQVVIKEVTQSSGKSTTTNHELASNAEVVSIDNELTTSNATSTPDSVKDNVVNEEATATSTAPQSPHLNTSTLSQSGNFQNETDNATTTNISVDVSSSTTDKSVVEDTNLSPAPEGESTVAVSSAQSDSEIQFNKNDCVTVSDGSFYCQPKEKMEKVTVDDGFYSLPDDGGDFEIYLKKDGKLNQITFNDVDDSAPYYDAKSNSLVWHRLVDDRFQIISYDLSVNQEVQLTTGSENNMEPTRSGKYTVWQRWNKNNWDIVLYDGTEVRFLSTSPEQDIAPKIKGDYVMWNRLLPTGGQEIQLYDVQNDEYTTISDEDGGSLSNPRMVLVYESEFQNGDVITKGYDMFTGKITPLSTKPVDLPSKIPLPETTGETKALLQPKGTSKEDIENSSTIVPGVSSGNNDPNQTMSTSTLDMSTSTLNTNFSTTTIMTEPSGTIVTPDTKIPTNMSELDRDQFDLIIPAYTPQSTSTSGASISESSSTTTINTVS